jgi:glycosyltransferase involved in cell wall biosynthesis
LDRTSFSSDLLSPKVSFIVPVRNRGSMLRSALASCLSQSTEAWEAIVVDDHSDEDIHSIVASFSDRRFRYYRLQSSQNGVAAARQAAIAQASTDVFITLDADDINHPHRAFRCADILIEASPRLIYTRVRLFSHKTGRNRPKPILHPYCSELLKYFNFITNPGTAFNRAAYHSAGGNYDQSLKIGEDYDLYLRMSTAAVQVFGLDEEHVSYRKAAGSTTQGQMDAMHEALMYIRAKHSIPPFCLETCIRRYALPELASTILDDPATTALWCDDRWPSTF